MKPLVIHITVISLVSLRITFVYNTNAIIVLFEVSCNNNNNNNPQKVLSHDDVPAKAFKTFSFHYIHCYCE